MTEKKLKVDDLKGVTLEDVRVPHSDKPAQLNSKVSSKEEVHLSPAQEKHLPHDPRHVITQKAGRVTPTSQLCGLLENDSVGLEHEADKE